MADTKVAEGLAHCYMMPLTLREQNAARKSAQLELIPQTRSENAPQGAKPSKRRGTKYKDIREAAELAGLKRYVPNEPCGRGHVADRWVSNDLCVECVRQDNKALHKADPIRTWSHNVWQRLRRYSRDNPHTPLLVTRLYIKSLATERCPVLGLKLTYSSAGCGKTTRQSATPDKIVPKLGYVPGNVVVISMKANQIKNDGTSAEIRAVADWLEALEIRQFAASARPNAQQLLETVANGD